jgi:UDP-glucose 4-epimerase
VTNVLVTGGAGYIGSHACKALRAAGFTPVTFDNLETGWQDAVKFGPFERGDLMDRARLDEVFAKYAPVAVMHFAALSQVGDSMKVPGVYWRNNVLGSLTLIEAATEAGCLDFEAAYGLRHVIFRYFNVAGADPEGEVGEFHQPETHLIPLMLDAIAGKRSALTVFGTDYETPDGTCIRDYVHVCDLVDAHVLGLKWLKDGKGSCVFNLGTGSGFSVREVIDHSRAVTNQEVPYVDGDRRPGDCTKLVSGSTRAEAELGWAPTRSTLETMITDAWRWHQTGHYDA